MLKDKPQGYDFAGYASRYGVKCDDGAYIAHGAFAKQEGEQVQLVWNHMHGSIQNVLGYGILEMRPKGPYVYGYLDPTPEGKAAKARIAHGSITDLSIFANSLVRNGAVVQDGVIREVSLCTSGMNRVAKIEEVVAHSALGDENGMISAFCDRIHLYGDDPDEDVTDNISHAATDDEEKEKPAKAKKEDSDDFDPEEVFATLNDKQKALTLALVAAAKAENDDANRKKQQNDDEEDDKVQHSNVYESAADAEYGTSAITFDSNVKSNIMRDVRNLGSLRQAFIAHAADMGFADADEADRAYDAYFNMAQLDGGVISHSATYGIDGIENLFPDFKDVTDRPQWIKRDTGWVDGVLSKTHKTPFAKIRSRQWDITADAARAKGYVKGGEKVDEIILQLKRETGPCTVYKKQRFDNDDLIDLPFDVLPEIHAEMLWMLREEIARAYLIGDGRSAVDPEKIKEDCIRPVWKDVYPYVERVAIEVDANTTAAQKAQMFIDAMRRTRKLYRGAGNPTLYAPEEIITECTLLVDGFGHYLYPEIDDLKKVLRVQGGGIETPEIFEGSDIVRTADGYNYTLAGILVNMVDYNTGTNPKGGIKNYSDFDIRVNQHHYLTETRLSGALVTPRSAIVYEFKSVAG